MAAQLISQLANLHQQDIICKYLSPKHIGVMSGFKFKGDPIQLFIKNLAVLQLIDCTSGVPLSEKTCGLNNTFMAPEIEDISSVVTPLADVWSLGAILYSLVAGCIRNITVTQQDNLFDFSEPEWTMYSEHVKEFVQCCLVVDPHERLSLYQLNQLPLMQMHRENALEVSLLNPSLEQITKENFRIYQAQTSSVIHDIIHRQVTFNEEKIRKIQELASNFIVDDQVEKARQDPSLNLSVIRDLLGWRFDELES